jgi:hypothetical protein
MLSPSGALLSRQRASLKINTLARDPDAGTLCILRESRADRHQILAAEQVAVSSVDGGQTLAAAPSQHHASQPQSHPDNPAAESPGNPALAAEVAHKQQAAAANIQPAK